MDQSERSTAGSLLTASNRSVSIVLSFKGRGSLFFRRGFLICRGEKALPHRLQNRLTEQITELGIASDRFDFVSFHANRQ